MCVCVHLSVNMRVHSRVFAENLLTDSWDGGWHNPVIRRCVRLQSWCVCVRMRMCVCLSYIFSMLCCACVGREKHVREKHVGLHNTLFFVVV
jgi:hypothetical protein